MISTDTREKSVGNVRRMIKEHEINRRENEILQDIDDSWPDMGRFRELNPDLDWDEKRVYTEKSPRKKHNPVWVTSQSGYKLWARIKRRAESIGVKFTLPVKYCDDLAPCTYCGGEASGFDRVDSDLGYTLKNTVPACGTCNSMKMRKSVPEFLAHIEKILNFSSNLRRK